MPGLGKNILSSGNIFRANLGNQILWAEKNLPKLYWNGLIWILGEWTEITENVMFQEEVNFVPFLRKKLNQPV